MKTCFAFLLSAFLFSSLSFGDTTCVKLAGEGDIPIERPILANQIGTTHFIIHWESPTTQTYAQNAADYAEYAYEKQCGVNEMNWRVPPSDDNRGGDNRYDIYLLNENNPAIQGSRGRTIYEIIGNWTYEWAPSFILIINILPTDNVLKMVVAHEFNHASQLAYTYQDIGNDTWFYENTAVWMAEMTYNYAYNYYQRYFNEGPDPLDNPHFGIHSNWGIGLGWYNYAGFLWPKFLAEWRDDDIIRKIWNRMGIIPGENILNDINIILMSQYSTNLDEAVRFYAEWRYFTGERNDGFHFNNASNLSTSVVEAEHHGNTGNKTIKLNGFGGVLFIEFLFGKELIEINFNGEDDYKWVAAIIEDKYPPSEPINRKIVLDGNYDGSIDAINVDVEKIILTPILNEDVIKKDCIYKGTGFEGREVFFYNKIGTTIAGGQLRLDGTEDLNSGESDWLRMSSDHNIKTLNERFENTEMYKHNNWNGNSNIFFLNRDFTVQSSNNNQNANFVQLYPATIRNVIDGISFNDGVPIEFNDPWVVKDQYDNQSGMENFLPVSSPFSPTGHYNQSTGGVFLDQEYDPNGVNPFYSVRSPVTQDFPLTQTGRTHKFYFQDWSSSGTDPLTQNNILNGYYESPVVFRNSNANVTANLKGTQLSNDANAYKNNSQRKFIRSADYANTLHMVYESMGHVWYDG